MMARALYSTYTEAVGGVNFKGEPLPSADEFFSDESKQKQADAWRKVVTTHYPYTAIKDHIEGMTDLPWYIAMEAMKDGWGVRRASWEDDVQMRVRYADDEYVYYFTSAESPGKNMWVITAFLPNGDDWEIVGPQLNVEKTVKSTSDMGCINNDPTLSEAGSAPYSNAHEEE